MRLRLLDPVETTSTEPEALVEWLTSRCQHVEVDDRLATLGYRFYPMGSADLPSFFCRRFNAGKRIAAVALLGGIDPRTGEGVLEDCDDTDAALLQLGEGRGGLWAVRITYGPRMLDLRDLHRTLRERDPAAFEAIAAELFALHLEARATCSLCTHAREDDSAF